MVTINKDAAPSCSDSKDPFPYILAFKSFSESNGPFFEAGGEALEMLAFEFEDGELVKKYDSLKLLKYGVSVETEHGGIKGSGYSLETRTEKVIIEGKCCLPLYILWEKFSRKSGTGLINGVGKHIIFCLKLDEKGAIVKKEAQFDRYLFVGDKGPTKPLSKYFSEKVGN